MDLENDIVETFNKALNKLDRDNETVSNLYYNVEKNEIVRRLFQNNRQIALKILTPEQVFSVCGDVYYSSIIGMLNFITADNYHEYVKIIVDKIANNKLKIERKNNLIKCIMFIFSSWCFDTVKRCHAIHSIYHNSIFNKQPIQEELLKFDKFKNFINKLLAFSENVYTRSNERNELDTYYDSTKVKLDVQDLCSQRIEVSDFYDVNCFNVGFVITCVCNYVRNCKNVDECIEWLSTNVVKINKKVFEYIRTNPTSAYVNINYKDHSKYHIKEIDFTELLKIDDCIYFNENNEEIYKSLVECKEFIKCNEVNIKFIDLNIVLDALSWNNNLQIMHIEKLPLNYQTLSFNTNITWEYIRSKPQCDWCYSRTAISAKIYPNDFYDFLQFTYKKLMETDFRYNEIVNNKSKYKHLDIKNSKLHLYHKFISETLYDKEKYSSSEFTSYAIVSLFTYNNSMNLQYMLNYPNLPWRVDKVILRCGYTKRELKTLQSMFINQYKKTKDTTLSKLFSRKYHYVHLLDLEPEDLFYMDIDEFINRYLDNECIVAIHPIPARYITVNQQNIASGFMQLQSIPVGQPLNIGQASNVVQNVGSAQITMGNNYSIPFSLYPGNYQPTGGYASVRGNMLHHSGGGSSMLPASNVSFSKPTFEFLCEKFHLCETLYFYLRNRKLTSDKYKRFIKLFGTVHDKQINHTEYLHLLSVYRNRNNNRNNYMFSTEI